MLLGISISLISRHTNRPLTLPQFQAFIYYIASGLYTHPSPQHLNSPIENTNKHPSFWLPTMFSASWLQTGGQTIMRVMRNYR